MSALVRTNELRTLTESVSISYSLIEMYTEIVQGSEKYLIIAKHCLGITYLVCVVKTPVHAALHHVCVVFVYIIHYHYHVCMNGTGHARMCDLLSTDS